MLSVKELYKEYTGDHGKLVKAAQNISLDIAKGELFTLLGPSGCGKTTTLRSIAGLEKPSSGEIIYGDRIIYSSEKKIFIAPNKRDIGMVFQSYAIWPHMNVFQNVAFPLQVGKKKYSKKEIEEKVLRALHVVSLDGLESREATNLSGGQQQRLALARALVMEPDLLLLDEPLSNLDAKLRERMRFELKRLQKDLGITTIYVTHDQSEALALSNKIAVMSAGFIQQIGTPREIYEMPANEFVADFIGTTNFVSGKIIGSEIEPGYYKVKTQYGDLVAHSIRDLEIGDQIQISIRPENIHVSVERPAFENVWTATLDTKLFLGEFLDFQLRIGDDLLMARVHPSLRIDRGRSVFLGMDPAKCIVIDDSSKNKIIYKDDKKEVS
ncbi:ABC transporter ATP-binding protein [Bacillus sp. Marseille-P3661]|uniref:ABC transporter ATP-binding protein n=1 Tax=Bacillus sp. Marseille-P3661 TaxID=1936234 RepID=UPI000C821C33|nr:ABC transporter ATP-binding protein [Bacillus sp. Marseille-P3661]